MPGFIKFSGVEGEADAAGYEGWIVLREFSENAGAEINIKPMSPTLLDEWRDAERLFRADKYLEALEILRPMSVQPRTSENDTILGKVEQRITECEAKLDELKIPDKNRGRIQRREPGFNLTIEIDRSFPDLVSRAAELVDIEESKRRNSFDEILIHLCTSSNSERGPRPYLMCKIENARIRSFTLQVNAHGGTALPTGRLVIDYGNDAERITWSYNTDFGATIDTLLLEQAYQHEPGPPLSLTQDRLEAAQEVRFPAGYERRAGFASRVFPDGYDYDVFRGDQSFPPGYSPRESRRLLD